MDDSTLESLTGSRCEGAEIEGERLVLSFEDAQILFIDGPWRIDDPVGPIAGALDDLSDREQEVAELDGASVIRAETEPPGHDTCLVFSNDLRLWIFADRIDGPAWTINRVSPPDS